MKYSSHVENINPDPDLAGFQENVEKQYPESPDGHIENDDPR